MKSDGGALPHDRIGRMLRIRTLDENSSCVLFSLFFDCQPPDVIIADHAGDNVAFGLCRTGDVANPSRIIQNKFQSLSASHLFESDFRMRPIQRAFDTPQVESQKIGFHH
jgi:hypothetical protein